jgi:hypothetical protein
MSTKRCSASLVTKAIDPGSTACRFPSTSNSARPASTYVDDGRCSFRVKPEARRGAEPPAHRRRSASSTISVPRSSRLQTQPEAPTPGRLPGWAAITSSGSTSRALRLRCAYWSGSIAMSTPTTTGPSPPRPIQAAAPGLGPRWISIPRFRPRNGWTVHRRGAASPLRASTSSHRTVPPADAPRVRPPRWTRPSFQTSLAPRLRSAWPSTRRGGPSSGHPGEPSIRRRG